VLLLLLLLLLLQDMPLLGLHPDAVSHASDYFAAMIADVAPLIESGLLYADDTPVELVRLLAVCVSCCPAVVVHCWQHLPPHRVRAAVCR
jgi:hypothetical protein